MPIKSRSKTTVKSSASSLKIPKRTVRKSSPKTTRKSATRTAKRVAQTKQSAKLDDVRIALENSHSSWWAQGGNDFIMFSFLCTGLAIFLQLALLSALGEHVLLRAMAGIYTVELNLIETASQTQSNAFLQAALALPQVESAGYRTKEQQFEEARGLSPNLFASLNAGMFTDAVSIDLHSANDYGTLFAFLSRPELRSVVAPSFLVQLPKQRREFLEIVNSHSAARRSFVWLAVACAALFFFTVALSVRMRLRHKAKQIKTLLMLGTDIRIVRHPFLMEAAALTLGAILLSFLLVGIGTSLMVSQFSLFSLLSVMPWVVLTEVCVGLAMVTLAMRFSPLPSRA